VNKLLRRLYTLTYTELGQETVQRVLGSMGGWGFCLEALETLVNGKFGRREERERQKGEGSRGRREKGEREKKERSWRREKARRQQMEGGGRREEI
jgi:hypothetical protein